jgi:hypothetical protein
MHTCMHPCMRVRAYEFVDVRDDILQVAHGRDRTAIALHPGRGEGRGERETERGRAEGVRIVPVTSQAKQLRRRGRPVRRRAQPSRMSPSRRTTHTQRTREEGGKGGGGQRQCD